MALNGQFGYKSETTVGSAVTPDLFLPVDSGTAISADRSRLESEGIRAGRRTTAAWKPGQELFSGSVDMDLWNTSVAPLWKHIFGDVATSGAGPFTHTYTPGDLTGDGFTAQLGIPQFDGATVHPFTFAGCKVTAWSLTAEIDEIAKLSLDVAAMTETTGTALASATYDSALAPFVFTEASLTLAGAGVNTVKSVELNGDNGLTDRVRLGTATSREYLENAIREYTGSITTDFEDLTAYNRFVNGTEAALVLAFDNGTDTLTFTLNVRFDGESPELTQEITEQPLEIKAVSATSDADAITAVLVNPESSAV